MSGSKKREKYRFGNFDHYYKDRNHERWNDPRMSLMQKNWFYQKKVVDIGSNDGTFTILLACNFDPALISGIELDSRLVNRAVENTVFIEKIRSQLIQNKDQICALEEFNSFPLSFRSYLRLPNYITSLTPLISLKNFISTEGSFPKNISFSVENILQATWSADTVLFLSTSKWVHLNWGDSGIKTLFIQIFRNLSPGGFFVFEPQDWRSYKKSKFKVKELSRNFDEIQFKPEDFHGFLISIGFLQVLDLPCDGDKPNFNRPILVYTKPAESTSE